MNEQKQKQNGEFSPADRYDWRESIKDTVNGFKLESNQYKDFDGLMEKLDPSLNKKYSDDGPPSYWLNKWVNSNLPGFEQEGLVLMYAYFYMFTRKRIAELTSDLNSIKNQVSGFDAKFDALQKSLDKITSEQTVLATAIEKSKEDLKSNLSANLQDINKVTTDQATRVINDFP